MPWELTGNAGTGTDPNIDFLGTTDNQPLVISTNALERMRITPDGQAWFKGMLRIDSGHITTNVPNGALVLNAGPPDATNVAGIWFRKTTVLGDPSAYTDLMRITADGNVGIGTTTPGPGAKLTVAGSISVTALGTYSNIEFTGHPVEISTGYSSDDFNLFMGADRTNQLSYIQSGHHNIGKATLALNPQGGNVGIGTSQPDAMAMLDVRGQASIQGPLSINHAGMTGVGSPGDNRAAITFGATDTSAAYFLGAYSGDTGKANTILGLYSYQFGDWLQFWSPNGNVGIRTTTPGATLTVNGDVSVSGDVILTDGHADCAEEFDIAEAAETEPGTVVVFDQDGVLHQSRRAYDKRVAGVISGAGDYKPGLILDRQQSQDNRVPVALVGKVYCKVDAQYTPIEVGDLLTTSPTPGHAMKADDPLKAFGAVIGKALRGLQSGQDLVPILVALQ